MPAKNLPIQFDVVVIAAPTMLPKGGRRGVHWQWAK